MSDSLAQMNQEQLATIAMTGAAPQDPRELFAELAEGELSASYRLAARLLGNRHDAEDAVHEAVLKAWASFDSLRDPSHFAPWLSRIVVNTCRNMLERRCSIRFRPLADSDPETRDEFGESLVRDSVCRAMAALSPAEHITIVLRYWNDLSVDEIARLTGVPAGTVKWRLHAACRRLRTEIHREGEPNR
jgi:RNA polymerase sigma-70 factor (ECF subfamily)